VLALLLTSALAAAACPDPDELVTQATDAVLEARLDDAEASLTEAQQALGCGAVTSAELLGRFWLAEGAMLVFRGQDEDALASLAASARIAPNGWDARFGTRVGALFDQPAAAGAHGGIVVTPPPGESLRIDGEAATSPASVAPGLHLVQVLSTEHSVGFARVVKVPSDAEVSVASGIEAHQPTEAVVDRVDVVEPAPLPIPVVVADPIVVESTPLPVPLEPPKQRFPVGFAVAGGATFSALAFAGAAGAETSAMRQAETETELNAAYKRQSALGITSYSLLAAATSAVVVEVVIANRRRK
jgi:hypothetical protein